MAITVNPALGVGGGLKPTLNPNPSSAGQVNNSYSNGSSGMDFMSMLQADREMSLASARETNAFNAAEAEKARQWQKEFYGMQHQLEVEDLKKAGLNPVLSASNGSSAASAAMASGVKADTPSGANALANIMSAAMTASAMISVANINANSALNVAKQQGTNGVNVAQENHKNSMYGSFWNLLDAIGENKNSASNAVRNTLKKVFK